MRMAERATPMHTLLTLTEVEGAAPARRRRVQRRCEGEGGADGTVRPQRVFKTMPPTLTRVKGSVG